LCAGRTRVRFAFFGEHVSNLFRAPIIPENAPDVVFIAPDHKACIGVPPTASGATTDARGGTHRGNTPNPLEARFSGTGLRHIVQYKIIRASLSADLSSP